MVLDLTPYDWKLVADNIQGQVWNYDDLVEKLGEIEYLRNPLRKPNLIAQYHDYFSTGDPFVQYGLRKRIVEKLNERIDCDIAFPELEDNRKKEGMKVRLTSMDYPNELAEITRMYSSSNVIEVLLDDGRHTSYNKTSRCVIPLQSYSIAELRNMNGSIISDISRTPFIDFIGGLENMVAAQIAGSEHPIRSGIYGGFGKGDSVLVCDSDKIGIIEKILGVNGYNVSGTYRRHEEENNLEQVKCKEEIIKDGIDKYSRKTVDDAVSLVLADIYEEEIKDNVSVQLIDKLIETGCVRLSKEGQYVPDQEKLFKLRAPKLASAYENSELYKYSDMFAPPSERKPNILRLELTQGCDYNGCTYCDCYRGISHKTKPIDEFRKHVDDVLNYLGDYKSKIKKIFLGGGNALGVDHQTLVDALRYINDKFGGRIKTSLYARTIDIKNKTRSELEELRSLGLYKLYWGIESGSDEVLRYVRKNTSHDDMLIAGYKLNSARIMDLGFSSRIEISAMIMLGLGGKKYNDSHVAETVKLLNEFKTDYLTFITTNPSPQSVYAKIMADEIEKGENRPLTEREIVEQIRDIIAGLEPRDQNIGMNDECLDFFKVNPISFNTSSFDEYEKARIVTECNVYLSPDSCHSLMDPVIL